MISHFIDENETRSEMTLNHLIKPIISTKNVCPHRGLSGTHLFRTVQLNKRTFVIGAGAHEAAISAAPWA